VLQYRDGMFLPAPAQTSLERAAQEAKADEKFCTNIIRFTGQGRNVSVKPSAPTYAPTEFAKEPEAKKFGLKKADFEAAMHRLLDAGKIWNEPYWSTIARMDPTSRCRTQMTACTTPLHYSLHYWVHYCTTGVSDTTPHTPRCTCTPVHYRGSSARVYRDAPRVMA
jgi:hypothetical protein